MLLARGVRPARLTGVHHRVRQYPCDSTRRQLRPQRLARFGNGNVAETRRTVRIQMTGQRVDSRCAAQALVDDHLIWGRGPIRAPASTIVATSSRRIVDSNYCLSPQAPAFNLGLLDHGIQTRK